MSDSLYFVQYDVYDVIVFYTELSRTRNIGSKMFLKLRMDLQSLRKVYTFHKF